MLLGGLLTGPLFPVYSWALGDTSIIEVIQKSLPSLVHIQAENVGVVRGPDTAVRDGATQRVFIVNPLAIAHYARQGGGVIIDPSGIIVTNAHTVQQAGRVKAILNDGTVTEAQVIWLDNGDDLAFLRINVSVPLEPMRLAAPETIRLGGAVYNVGTSDVLKGTITGGKIIGIGSKTDDSAGKTSSITLLKIDFDVYRGDSGGPVINDRGELVGLIVAGSTEGRHISLAVPSNKIKMHFLECCK